MAVTIPVKGEELVPFFEMRIELESVTYTLEFRWNDRDGAWYMSIGDAEGEIIAAGRKVVIDLPLFFRFVDPRLPPGQFFGVDTSGQKLDAGYEDLGERVQLIYFESTEPLVAS